MKRIAIACLVAAGTAGMVAAQAETFFDNARVRSVEPQYENVAVPRQQCSNQFVQEQRVVDSGYERNYGGVALGGIAGGVLSGRVVDRIGGRPAMLLWVGVQTMALALALVPGGTAVLASAVAAGFAAVGVTTVMLSVCREIAPAQSAALWVRATAVFGIVQTSVAFAAAPLFAATGESHDAVFAVGLASSIAAVGAAVALARMPARMIDRG